MIFIFLIIHARFQRLKLQVIDIDFSNATTAPEIETVFPFDNSFVNNQPLNLKIKVTGDFLTFRDFRGKLKKCLKIVNFLNA